MRGTYPSSTRFLVYPLPHLLVSSCTHFLIDSFPRILISPSTHSGETKRKPAVGREKGHNLGLMEQMACSDGVRNAAEAATSVPKMRERGTAWDEQVAPRAQTATPGRGQRATREGNSRGLTESIGMHWRQLLPVAAVASRTSRARVVRFSHTSAWKVSARLLGSP
jgi:hypothetical protein